MKASDLRGILQYVPRFRDRIFVINVDSIVLSDENISNFFMDVSVLRSLNIRIIIVHGASVQLRLLADELGCSPSDLDGSGITDENTLKLSLLAASRNSHLILQGLSDNDLRGAVTNAIVAHPRGIIRGEDQLFTGKVEKVDVAMIEKLLNEGITPVIPPIGFDGDGGSFRVNSDGVALQVAKAMGASKLIFLTTSNGIWREDRWVTQMPISEARDYMKHHAGELSPEIASKMMHAIEACEGGVRRAHILDGLQEEGLLDEIFSNEGVCTMIFANEYTSIRPAKNRDARRLVSIIRKSVDNQELAQWTYKVVSSQIKDFYVFEIDSNIVGCVSLKRLTEDSCQAELGCLFVSEGHSNQGIGSKLVEFVEARARELGVSRLFALSTQAFNYFKAKRKFQEGAPEFLPEERRNEYLKSGRNSRVLYKDL